MTHDDAVKRAMEILEGTINYDQWRDNLHVNDFAWTKQAFASAIQQAYQEGMEAAAKIAKKEKP